MEHVTANVLLVTDNASYIARQFSFNRKEIESEINQWVEAQTRSANMLKMSVPSHGHIKKAFAQIGNEPMVELSVPYTWYDEQTIRHLDAWLESRGYREDTRRWSRACILTYLSDMDTEEDVEMTLSRGWSRIEAEAVSVYKVEGK